MVAVSPTPAAIHLATRPPRKNVKTLRAVARWVRRIVGRLPGEYTIGKLDALDRFRKRITPPRLLSVLLLTPIPCFVACLMLESIPLADPATGFQGSLHFQIRNFLTAMIMTTAPVLVRLNCVPQLSPRSWKFAVLYGLTAAITALVTNSVIALLAGVFPIPFTQFMPTIPMAVVGGLLNRRFLSKPEFQARLDKIDQWAAMDVAPIFVYPIFTAVFMALKPDQQLWVSLLLPVIKLLIRYFIWSILKDDLDMVGATACSVGHLYHLLFTAMCLQNAKSLQTLAAVVTVSFIQMLLNCRRILRDARKLRRTRGQLIDSSGEVAGDMISATLVIAKNDQVARALHQKNPSRLFSKYPEYQGTSFMTKYHEILQTEIKAAREQNSSSAPVEESEEPTQGPRRDSRHRSLIELRMKAVQDLTQILPEPKCPQKLSHVTSVTAIISSVRRASISGPRTSSVYESQSASNCQDEVAICSVTSALQQTEIILLRSYITIFIMTFYGIYLVLVFNLPNRQYFATMAFTTTLSDVNNMTGHLLLLCGIELFFMAVYLTLIRKYLQISGLHQLAFVLWSQRVPLQAKFVGLSLMILGFPLEHYGNGVIFRLKSEE